MTKFAEKKIDSIHGKQEFYKLIINGECPIDEFEKQLNTKEKKELPMLYVYMEQIANNKLLPKTIFRPLEASKGSIKEYEFKTKNLRFYAIQKPNGKLVVWAGKKSNQKNDIRKFREIKDAYLKSINSI